MLGGGPECHPHSVPVLPPHCICCAAARRRISGRASLSSVLWATYWQSADAQLLYVCLQVSGCTFPECYSPAVFTYIVLGAISAPLLATWLVLAWIRWVGLYSAKVGIVQTIKEFLDTASSHGSFTEALIQCYAASTVPSRVCRPQCTSTRSLPSPSLVWCSWWVSEGQRWR